MSLYDVVRISDGALIRQCERRWEAEVLARYYTEHARWGEPCVVICEAEGTIERAAVA